MAKRHFTPALFVFLRELEANNDKAWWDANKERYLAQVRDPALEFIIDFGARLEKISPHFVAEAKATGGSLMRPYRDTRFSMDKTPYKTNVGIQFRHEAGKDIHAPGYYVHLEPGSCFVGVGLWHPETTVARALRQAIHDDVDGWSSATQGHRLPGHLVAGSGRRRDAQAGPVRFRPGPPPCRRPAHEIVHRRGLAQSEAGDRFRLRRDACRDVRQGERIHPFPVQRTGPPVLVRSLVFEIRVKQTESVSGGTNR